VSLRSGLGQACGLWESSDTLVAKIADIISDYEPEGGPTRWKDQSTVGVVTDSLNVMRRARAIFIAKDMFALTHGCISHALSNLAKDVLKIPDATKALSFCTTLAKFFSRHLPREHFRAEAAKHIPPPRTIKLHPSTRWTFASGTVASVLGNMQFIKVVVMMSKARNINMEMPQELFDAVMEQVNWNRLKRWHPILREIAAVNNYVQGDNAPLSAVHLVFLYLELAFQNAELDCGVKVSLKRFLQNRYTSVYSPGHAISFYLNPLLLECWSASKKSSIKPFTGGDVRQCTAAASSIVRHGGGSANKIAGISTAVTGICAGAAPYHTPRSPPDLTGAPLAHVYWQVNVDSAPDTVRGGERSFKQRS
jgi:hypothetical protein